MDRLSSGRVVERDPVVLADREKLAIGAKGDTKHPPLEWNRTDFIQSITLGSLKVPELDGLIPANGSEGSTVRGKGHGPDNPGMAAKRMAESDPCGGFLLPLTPSICPEWHLPYLHGVVPARRGEP